MDLPALMPSNLNFYAQSQDENTLFDELIKRPNDLVSFFETAADDETWSELHAQFMQKLLERLTEQTYQDKISLLNYQKAAHAIQKHYSVLKSILPLNLKIKLKDEEVPVNGLLLMASSEFFKDLIITAASKNTHSLDFPQMSKNEFLPIYEHICTGNVVDLQTQGVGDIIHLIKRAKAWDLAGLTAEAEFTLKKYLNTENVFEMLTLAKKEHWNHFGQHCADFINQQSWGFKIFLPTAERLAFQFLDFQERTIDSFEDLRPLVTDLICNGTLIDQPQFGLILRECSDLFLLDISRTQTFSPQLQEVSKRLSALNISECPWVSKETPKNLQLICPSLTHLFLRSNLHLNYLFWGELAKLKALTQLDLSLCTQLQDSDFDILMKGLTGLTELSLSGCKKIGEGGFLELAKSLTKIIRLDLSRTNLSDTALVEIISRCRGLTALNLSSCNLLTEKGILASVKTGLMLQSLNVSHCEISPAYIEEIQKNYPQIDLVTSGG